MRRFAISLAATLIAFNLALATVSAAPQFALGFAALASQIPSVVGQPVEAEHYGPNGDSLQRTTTGLMVWRKADNWTAFTNGARTWVNGPFGVMERANDERFSWEGVAPPSATSGGPTATAEQTALDMINGSRQALGVPPVVMDEAIRQVARAHAADMAARNYFGHYTPEGASPFDQMRSAGIAFGTAAENIGWGQGYANPTDSVRANHDVMMAETPPNDGHRRNILNPALHRVGIGVAQAPDGKVYYVCDFAD